MWMVVQAETYLWYHHLPFACRKLDKSKFEKSTSTRQYQNADGEVKFQGTPNLVDTQVYPPKFGRKVTLMKPYVCSVFGDQTRYHHTINMIV